METEVDRLNQYYAINKVPFLSEGFHIHQELVFDVYKPRGFLDEISSAAELVDVHDGEEANYYVLTSPEPGGELAGTFRIIEDRGQGLPALSAYPRLHIEGIQSRLCESTRVVSVRRNLSGRSQLTKQILFEAVINAVVHVKSRDLYAVISLGGPNIFEWINATFSGSQRAFASPSEYHGGIVVPSIIWLDEFEKNTKRSAPSVYEYYQNTLAKI